MFTHLDPICHLDFAIWACLGLGAQNLRLEAERLRD